MQNVNQKSLPKTGFSRFGQFKHRLPFSREKWRQLVRDKKAPQKIVMGERCTFYKNSELHKFFADPLNYEQAEPTENEAEGGAE